MINYEDDYICCPKCGWHSFSQMKYQAACTDRKVLWFTIRGHTERIRAVCMACRAVTYFTPGTFKITKRKIRRISFAP